MSPTLRIVELFPGAFFPQGDGGNVLGLAWRARRQCATTVLLRLARP